MKINSKYNINWELPNCENCPYNVGHDGNGFDCRFPCDQQNCWYELNKAGDED